MFVSPARKMPFVLSFYSDSFETAASEAAAVGPNIAANSGLRLQYMLEDC